MQVKEVLRRWLRGQGERSAAQGAGVDRKTAHRYIAAAVEAGLVRNGEEPQLSEALIGQVCEAVRPSRPDGHGAAWRSLEAEQGHIEAWLKEGLTVSEVHVLLSRRGVKVPYRTMARFAVERCGAGREPLTVRVADPEPGKELQVDYGRLGLVRAGEHRKVVYALIFTACFSRHMFVWLCTAQTTNATIKGFEAAWAYFGGVFPVVIPDNLSPVVRKADATNPCFNDAFLEYAQERGFVIDTTRVRHPKDKPRVERMVPYVRENFFAGEEFLGLDDAQRSAVAWCSGTAGTRVHGTTLLRPLEAFKAFEAALLLSAPGASYDVPTWSEPKVHRDFHCEVGRSLYSLPHSLVGQRLRARADSLTVKFYSGGQLVKVHPRVAPGRRSTDKADYPSGKELYATRDLEALKKMAASAGPSVGAYAAELLSHPLPWTKMRQVYRLLGLVKKWGAERVEAACGRALEAEAVDVNLISRMLERAKEHATGEQDTAPNIVAGRFARDPADFSARRRAR